jgi:alpha,alpha-trehalose phosphorylase
MKEAKGWLIEQTTFEQDREAIRESHYALSNGTLGVRGGIEERARGVPSAFLAGVYERTQIHYHERLSGFAAATDTRIPVADGLRLSLFVDGEDVACGEIVAFERRLDLKRGVVWRRTQWKLPSGRLLEVTAERVVPFGCSAVVAIRLRVEALNFSGSLKVVSVIAADQRAEGQGADPRIGAALAGGGLRTEATAIEDGLPALSQCTQRSGIRVVCAQAHVLGNALRNENATVTSNGLEEVLVGPLCCNEPVSFEKIVAYAYDDVGKDARVLLEQARTEARAAADAGVTGLMVGQAEELATFWRDADIAFDGDPKIAQALRFNLFHLYQAVGRTPEHSVAAKGLSGEGYEGHYFWDTEAFVFPAVVLTAPKLARHMLEYRYRTLDAARAHARELNFPIGALYAWRTISGAECSAHYPSGSAQFHINAAVAFAIRLYDRATGDEAFLWQEGAEIIFETARIWAQLGHFNPRRDGHFCIDGVTGPDEYTVIVDNNFYTNKMAAMHLRYAVELAERFSSADPARFIALKVRIGIEAAEINLWRRAAEAMYLPLDERLGINPQDDTFLDKAPWNFAATPADRFPLLLHYHPLSLYRRQVCKQADVVLAMVLVGEDVPLVVKRRNFAYYEALTTHDSTLSTSTFSILASEIGRLVEAREYFEKTLFTDLGDLHGNSRHGVHMAAMAGSWLALSWGFGGLRCGTEPCFAPVLPPGCDGYRFTIVWRGSRLTVTVSPAATEYLLTKGPDLAIRHRGVRIILTKGQIHRQPSAEAVTAEPEAV